MSTTTLKTALTGIVGFCAIALSAAAPAQLSIHAGNHGISISTYDRWHGWHSRAEMFAHRRWDRRHRVWIYNSAPGWRSHHRH